MSHKVFSRPRITASYIRKLIDYDPHTGDFTWKVDRVGRGGRSKAGTTAGRPAKRGYVNLTIDRKCFAAHRLAFLWMVGRWPDCLIDHIDRRPDNNAWDNLREATQAQNMANMAPRPKKEPDLPRGINRVGRTRFQAAYGMGGYLGTFASIEEAREAYLKAAHSKGAREYLS